MLGRFGILIAVVLTLGACDAAIFGGGADGVHYIRPNEVERIRADQLAAVNATRAERGLSQLIASNALNSAADRHAVDISDQRRAWDFGSDRSTPQSRAADAGFSGRVTGENVAESFAMNDVILAVWLDDPRGRTAILHPDATHFGIGWHQDPDGRIWWVQLTAAGYAAPFVTGELQ